MICPHIRGPFIPIFGDNSWSKEDKLSLNGCHVYLVSVCQISHPAETWSFNPDIKSILKISPEMGWFFGSFKETCISYILWYFVPHFMCLQFAVVYFVEVSLYSKINLFTLKHKTCDIWLKDIQIWASALFDTDP